VDSEAKNTGKLVLLKSGDTMASLAPDFHCQWQTIQ